MANQVTVTSKTGPGQTVTGLVIQNVTDVDFQMDRFVVRIVANGVGTEFDLFNTATVTYTIASRNATLVINQ